MSKLKSLKDPETGENIITEIHHRKDLYTGPAIENIPDLVFVFNEDYIGNEMLGNGPLTKSIPAEGRPDPTHRMDGVYGFVGPNINSGKQIPANIRQLAPTLYTVAGLPHPREMDGSPIKGVYREEQGPEREEKSIESRVKLLDSPNDNDEVRDRLSDLGYL
jgi:predicted AlkP superfamily phosphohydrolase/phosphomutase